MLKVSKHQDGATVTRWLDTRTLEITFEGNVSQALTEQLVKDFIAATAERGPRYALFDMTTATGINASVRANATRFLSEFKLKGGREIIAVVTNTSVRMIGQALTFASGVQLKMFPSRETALTYIVSKLRED